MSCRNSPSRQDIRSGVRHSFSKMMSSQVRLTVFVIFVLVTCISALPVPEDSIEDFESTDEPVATRSPKVPKVHEKDLGIPDEDYDDYEDDPDYLTWEDLGRMIYSWAKLFAEPKQLKPLRKCLTGNAPRDAAALIKRVEACVRIVDPDFSLRKIANLLIGA